MYLFLACLAALAFTTGGVFMKQADGVRHALPVAAYVMLFGVGAALQSQAMRGTDLGATYVLVLGLEAALALTMGVLLFGESITVQKAGAVLLIVVGIAVLRVS
jgi:multidrug transporter EmrE-like cation transporter